MMNDIDYVLATLERSGTMIARSLQEMSSALSGTELNAERDYIPDFKEAVVKMNMLERKAGLTDGFVCRSSAGRVVRLIQNYDSTVYTDEPEELPAQFGFVWSDDPDHALPFVAISTSPYQVGNCCTENGCVYRSKIENNVYAPSAYSEGWEYIKEVNSD